MESDEDLVRINKLIEKELAEDKRKMRNRVKILLLGCGEAGKVIKKTSIFKNIFQKFSKYFSKNG